MLNIALVGKARNFHLDIYDGPFMHRKKVYVNLLRFQIGWSCGTILSTPLLFLSERIIICGFCKSYLP